MSGVALVGRRAQTRIAALAIAALFVGGVACGGAGRRAVEVRDVPAASGAPSVTRVVDLGNVSAPEIGAVPAADSDGVFVVGELILIEGDEFGKQPTVNIGGRPAEILARTGDGAIVTRVPPGIAAGELEVEVSHVGGRGARKVSVQRWALVVDRDGGALYAAALVADGLIVDGARPARLVLPGATAAGVSPDGQTALVAIDAGAGQRGQVSVVSLVAAGGPRVTRSIALADRPQLIAVAAQAPLAVVVGLTTATLIDLDNARVPLPHQPITLGDAAGKVSAAVLDPAGQWLALLVGVENRLVLVSVADRARPGAPRSHALAPDARVPLAVDVDLAPAVAGDAVTLWVVLGETAESRVAGVHPTEVVVVAADGAIGIGAPTEIAGAGAPVAMAVARREEVQGATAIRSTRRTQGFVLATSDADALAQNAPDAATLLRTTLEGESTRLWSAAAAVGDVAMVCDGAFAAVAAAVARPEPGGPRLDLSLITVPLGGGEPRTIRLGDVAGELAPRGSVRFASVALSP